jgi:hypothetical protein
MARKTGKGRKSGRGTFVVASTVKHYVRSKNLMASSELAATLSKRIQALLDSAIERCEGNGRRTVRPVDL